MVAESFLGQIPWFILILLGLSYIIWSKFLNGGKLTIKSDESESVHKLIEILLIFTFIFVSLVGLICFSQLLSLLGSNGNFNLIDSIKTIPPILFGMGLVLVFVFLVSIKYTPNNPKENRKMFKENIKLLIKAEFGGFIFFISFFILIMIFSYKVFITIPLTLYFLILSISLLILLIIVKTLVMPPNQRISVKSILINNYKLILIPLLIIVLGFLILFPKFHQLEQINLEYRIYSAGEDYSEVYIYKKLGVKNLDLGYKRSIYSVIPIKYGKYGLNLTENNKVSNNIRLTYNDSSNEREILQYYQSIESKEYISSENSWIEDLKVDKGVLGIFYDENKITNKDVKEVYLYGLVKTNIIKEEFYYNDDEFGYKYENNICRNKMVINNNLDLPVRIESKLLMDLNNRGISDTSNCSLHKIFLDKEEKGIISFYTEDCEHPRGCDIVLKEDNNETLRALITLDENSGAVEIYSININEPMSVNLTVDIRC